MALHLRALLPLATVLFLGAAGVHAQDAPYRRDISLAFRMLSQDAYEETYTDSITINAEAAISTMSQMSLSVNEHYFEWVGVEAATIKPDGRIIAVPSEQILSSSSPESARLGTFEADVRVKTIVFSGVEVGDVLTYSRTLRSIRPVVPGGFDYLISVPPHARYGDVLITLDAPADMPFAIQRDGFSEGAADAAGRRHYRWMLPEQPHVATERGSVSYFDHAPHVAISNRTSDAVIGRWFYSVASDKAAVTPEVTQTVREVTLGLEDRRAQARAIYDFVSTKVRYFNISIGQGGWIPHAANLVLKNRFGDCKDHVTLMRAMLAVKGIAADYVLLNASSPIYRAFRPPMTRYDHVILYLPEFDLYADPTDFATAFGVVPLNAAGKPGLHITADKVDRRTLPHLNAVNESVSVQAVIKVDANGRYSGHATWNMRDNEAMLLRRFLASAGMKTRAELMADLLLRASVRGKGVLEAGRESDHTEPFIAKVSFNAENTLLASPSERSPVPFGPHLLALPHSTYLPYQRGTYRLDSMCTPQAYEVSVDIHLHDSLKFGLVPLPVHIETAWGEFSASYQVTGRHLQVRRSWRMQSPAMTCSVADIVRHIVPLATTMSRDVNTRLVVQRVESDGSPL
ncbi:MAG: hypothetical protein JWN07_372 [Hyphomicrobiales bacterium]|nr:hypothetical protein [Hyphomicrobiales bacterium]